ncbi:MAG TPA: GWxTD domain-containing protein [Thermoanaerobaculia bacterium]|nr:GWxTD domain-containing protein [Thermoanaerobaculia bacterium]
MKSSSTCCAGRRPGPTALLAAGLVAAACAGGAAPRTIEDLTNPFLAPEHSQWLIGAVSRLATPEEVQAYLALRDDAAAAPFIRDFWVRRDPNPQAPGNPVLEAFEERSAAADRLYSESGVVGRRTARGTVHVLYGAPSKVDFEVSPRAEEPAIEVWLYPEGSPAGLDARSPGRHYRFIRRGDLTVPYVPRGRDPRFAPDPRQPPN